MSKLGKIVKDTIKAKKESVMGKLGDSPFEDPMEPWSAKYNAPVKEEVEDLTEDSILYRYIRSKGYSPEHMDFAHRSAFARSNAFKSYKVMHQNRKKKPTGGIHDIKAVAKEEVELTEAGVGKLMNFIKSKGLDPTSMDGNHKKHYSRSSEYRVFKTVHPDPDEARAKHKERTEKKKVNETSGMGERGDDWNEDVQPVVKVKPKHTHEVFHNKTGQVTGKYTSLARAHRAADKKDNEYGGYIHSVRPVKEEVDEADTVTMDIPLLIRVLEYAREDAKTDMDLHKVVENLINMRGEGTMSMAMYDKIVAIKEEIEKLDELSVSKLTSYREKAKAHISKLEKDFDAGDRSQKRATDIKKRDVGALRAFHKIRDKQKPAPVSQPTTNKTLSTSDAIAQDYKDQEKRRGIGHVRDHVEVEGQRLDEISKDLANNYYWSAKSDDEKRWKNIGSEQEKQTTNYSKARHKKVVKMLAKSSKRWDGRQRALKRMEEADEAKYGPKYQASVLAVKAKAEKKPVDMKDLAARMQASYAKDKKQLKELKNRADNMDVDDHITREEVEQISELSKTTLKSYINKRGETIHADKAESNVARNKAADLEYRGKQAQADTNHDEADSLHQRARKGATNVTKAAIKVAKKTNEDVVTEACSCETKKQAMKSARIIKSLYKKKLKESTYDWEKDDKGGKKATAKITVKGGTTMTGKPRDTVEIEPVLKTRPNSARGMKPGV